MKDPEVWIRFIQAWGHPTRNEIYGPSSGKVGVSRWVADNLISGGYAEGVKDD